MRLVVQRVSSASVTVGERTTGAIERGLVALIGVTDTDGDGEVEWAADKICNLRIFNDDEGKMNRSLRESGGGVLLVSQFTLYGDARKGRRPSFVHAARGPEAESIYERVAAAIETRGTRCATGEFGAAMEVSLVNDGPVTILLDSAKTFWGPRPGGSSTRMKYRKALYDPFRESTTHRDAPVRGACGSRRVLARLVAPARRGRLGGRRDRKSDPGPRLRGRSDEGDSDGRDGSGRGSFDRPPYFPPGGRRGPARRVPRSTGGDRHHHDGRGSQGARRGALLATRVTRSTALRTGLILRPA